LPWLFTAPPIQARRHFPVLILVKLCSDPGIVFIDCSYQDGVYNASAQVVPPQDELNLPAAWQQLINDNKLDAVVCVASALKRGIVDTNAADRYELPAANLLPGFTIGGLGQLIDATLVCDRILNFFP